MNEKTLSLFLITYFVVFYTSNVLCSEVYTVQKTISLRSGPEIWHSVVKVLEPGENFIVYQKKEEWVRVKQVIITSAGLKSEIEGWLKIDELQKNCVKVETLIIKKEQNSTLHQPTRLLNSNENLPKVYGVNKELYVFNRRKNLFIYD